MDNILIEFGNHVRDLRKAKNMSQEELSFASSLHRNYICDIERGARNISLKSLEKLAEGLEVTLSDLMKF